MATADRLSLEPTPEGVGFRSLTVTVPLHDELKPGTLRSIAESAGADDFEAFCDWIDRNS